ncbi:IS3 family transposase [Staphylococcus equorum]
MHQNHFRTLSELELKFCDYINWYNHHRIHGSLNYQSPIHFKLSTT